MHKARKIELIIVVVVFIAFLAIWLNSRQNAYAHDFWYYSWGQHVTENSGYGENGVMPGSFFQGHDLTLVVTRVLIPVGNFAVPAFFISFFCIAGWFMLKPLVRFPEAIFVVAPFSIVLLLISGTYFLFAQMLSMGFFFLAIGFYLRPPMWILMPSSSKFTAHDYDASKLVVMICLALMSISHSWSALFYLGAFGLYLIIKDRRFIAYIIPAILLLVATAPAGFLNFIAERSTIGSNFSYLVNVQLTENFILIPFLLYGAYRLMRSRVGLLFVIITLAPLATITVLWSPFWSYRVVTLIPILVFEAAGVSSLLEWIAKRGGV